MKALAAGIFTGLCANTIISGDVSVAEQALAQGSVAIVMLLGYFK